MGIFSPTSPQSPRFGPLANVPLTISGIDPGDTSRMTGMSPMPTLGMTRGGAGVMRAPMAVDGVDPNAAGTLADAPPAIDPQALPKATRAGILDDPTTRHALLRAGLATLATRNIGEGGLAAANYVDQQKAITAKAGVTAEELRLKNAAELREGTKADADVAYKQALVPALIDQHNAMADQARARGGYYTAQGDVLPMKVQGQIDYNNGRLDNQRYNTDQRVGAMERGQDIGATNNQARVDGSITRAGMRPGPLGAAAKPLSPAAFGKARAGILSGLVTDPAETAALAGTPVDAELNDAIATGWQAGGAGEATRRASGVLGKYAYTPAGGGFLGMGGHPASFAAKPQGAPAMQGAPAAMQGAPAASPQIARPAPAPAGASPVKVLNGHAYQKINGKWFDVGPAA